MVVGFEPMVAIAFVVLGYVFHIDFSADDVNVAVACCKFVHVGDFTGEIV